ncbi:hypothetical protein [Streptomyces sp. DW26H14]|uniref:hypothetical protein n=1 Tax=Streptomyces sp. DW26H14 TaxID=3435395 RepID=UPI00403E21FD
MTTRTLLLDCRGHDIDGTSTTFAAKTSCFDYDIVMWDVESTFNIYKPKETTAELPEIRGNAGLVLEEAISRRLAEFTEFLSLGRALIVFPSGKHEFHDINRRRLINLNYAIPADFVFTSGTGVAVEAKSGPMMPLWRSTKGQWRYRGILEQFPGVATLKVSRTDKIVGSINRFPDGGLLALLPALLNAYSLSKESENHSAWQALNSWVRSQISQEEETPPHWVSEYTFPEEKDLYVREARLQEEAKELEGRIAEVRRQIEDENCWKRLLYSQGKPLEIEVERALKVIGFEILETESGRADLRAQSGDQSIVVEVKGLKGSAAERHSAQLEKWATEEILAGEPSPKPVLVVNAWREAQLSDRTQSAFPDQMLTYAKTKGHCLLTTAQLLTMARTALIHPENAREILNLIVCTTGTISGWDPTADVLLKGGSQLPE